jgi:hypothetical protein
MGIEKRRYRRLDTELPAELKELSKPEAEARSVTIVNLGPEGAFAVTEDGVERQSELSISFRLDSYPMQINVTAKVLWQGKHAGQSGVGMCFTHIPLFEKNIIIDYILRRYAEHQAQQRQVY